MSWLTKLKIIYGSICPAHLAPTYWDASYGKLRCSMTGLPVESEHRDRQD